MYKDARAPVGASQIVAAKTTGELDTTGEAKCLHHRNVVAAPIPVPDNDKFDLRNKGECPEEVSETLLRLFVQARQQREPDKTGGSAPPA